MLTVINSKTSTQTIFYIAFSFISYACVLNIGRADIDIEIIADDTNKILTTSELPEEDFSGTVNHIDNNTAHYADINRLEDIADTIPGVFVGRNNAGAGSDFNIRGFELNGNIYSDGLLDHTNSFIRDPATIEAVEIIKGHDTVLFGAGTPGGTIQIVSKKPQYLKQSKVKFALGDPQRTRLEYDATGPINDKKTFLYRFILVRQEAKTGFSHVDDDRFTVLPMLRWLGEKTELQLSAEYTRQTRNFDYDTLLHNGEPVFGVSYLDPRAFAKRNNTLLNARFTHQINDQWKLKLQGNHVKAHQDEVNIGFFSRFPENLTADNPELNDFLLGSYLEKDDDYKQYDVKAELKGKFRHGEKNSHQLTIGYNANKTAATWNRTSGHFNFALNVLNPQFDYDLPTGDALTLTRAQLNDRTRSFYIHDTMNIGEKWVLSGGIRKNRFKGDTDSVTDLDIDNNSYSIGLTWKPSTQLSLYGSYSQSLSPNYGRDRNNRFFEPKEGEQYDVGFRYHNTERTLKLSTSLYNITQSNLKTVDLINPQFSTLLGEVRVKGIEVEANKKLSQQLNFRVGYSYMQGSLTKGSEELQGNRLNNVPKHSLSANIGYQILHGKEQKTAINLGAVYIGKRHGDIANSFTVDHFIRADFSLQHNLSKRASLNFSIKNLFDKDYIAASYNPITLTVGYPRRAVLSFEYLF